MTSARWHNRRSQSSFSHRNINLTIIYRPKNLCENSRSYLRRCGTPVDHRAENSYIETGKKSKFTLPGQPHPQASTASTGRERPACSFSLGEREGEKCSVRPMFQIYKVLGPRKWFLSCHIRSTDKISIFGMPEGHWEQRRMRCGLLCWEKVHNPLRRRERNISIPAFQRAA